jgi:aryl-alcohol dehydrogenase-like predicted oxidoreductase
MKYIRLGSTGMKVSRICLGTMTYGSSKWRNWVLNEEESLPFIKHALEQGINFFDTADFYSIGVCEEVVGKALKQFANREEIVLASKLYYAMSDDPNDQGLSRKHIFKSIDRSLKRLQTDFLDLYQIHRWDDNTPIEETMEALHEVVKSGKARYIGASSMYAWQFVRAQAVAEKNGWTKFVSMQNHYNLMYREEEREMIPCCIDQGVGVIPWSPLARGLLTGKKTTETSIRKDNDALAKDMYYKEEDQAVIDAVENLANESGHKPAHIALAWILQRQGITAPIIGASKTHHIDDAVAALDVKLTEEQIASLEAAYRPHPILGH